MPRITDLEKAIADGVAAGVARGNAGNRGGDGGFAASVGGSILTGDMLARAAGQLTQAMNSMATRNNIFANSDIPSSMRNQFANEAIPFGIGGGFQTSRNWINSTFSDDVRDSDSIFGGVSGAERMRQSGRAFAVSQQTDPAFLHKEQQIRQLRDQGRIATFRAHAIASIPEPTIAVFDQSTAAGARAQQEEMQRFPHRQAIAFAQAEVTAARQAHTLAQANLREAEQQASDDRERAMRFARGNEVIGGHTRDPAAHALDMRNPQAGVNRGSSGDWLDRISRIFGSDPAAASQAQIVAAQDRSVRSAGIAQGQGGDVNATAMAARQAEINLIQRGSELRQQEIALQQTNAQIMQQRAQALEGGAAAFGRMQPVDRRIALNSLVRARRNGWDSLTQQERQAAASVDPAYAHRMDIQAGENSAEFRQARELEGSDVHDIHGTVAENQRAAIEATRRAAAAELANQRQTTAGVAGAITRGNEALVHALDAGYTDLVRRVNEMITRANGGMRG